MAQHKRSVTVIGLGPMGRSMVKAYLEDGVDVTVWNRTPAKADDLVELGARRVDTVAEALDANDLVVLSLTHYQAMYDVLGQATDHLAGKTVANLSSDSPAKAREGAAWVIEHGGRFLSGGFMSQGDDIKHPVSFIYISGPRTDYEANRDLLRVLSPLEYLGDDAGLSQVFYQAELAIFTAFLVGLDQALATVERSGQTIERFMEHAIRFPDSLKDFMTEFAEQAAQGGWKDLAAIKMMHAGIGHVAETGEDVGVDASVTRAQQDLYRRALEASERTGRTVPVYQIIRGDTA